MPKLVIQAVWRNNHGNWIHEKIESHLAIDSSRVREEAISPHKLGVDVV